MMKKLNARQQAFVDIYTNPESRGFGNATKAAELDRETFIHNALQLARAGLTMTGSVWWTADHDCQLSRRIEGVA
ncbi:MAG: hypothetical protein AMS25_07600 [Gemmatimonas sp. SM23_52]|nr:MAG: hypothetical protein AMS25_07600 [Gemmatimonas sp. SM23_52]